MRVQSLIIDCGGISKRLKLEKAPTPLFHILTWKGAAAEGRGFRAPWRCLTAKGTLEKKAPTFYGP